MNEKEKVMEFSVCSKCEDIVGDENIYWVKGRGWVCETCLDQEGWGRIGVKND